MTTLEYKTIQEINTYLIKIYGILTKNTNYLITEDDCKEAAHLTSKTHEWITALLNNGIK